MVILLNYVTFTFPAFEDAELGSVSFIFLYFNSKHFYIIFQVSDFMETFIFKYVNIYSKAQSSLKVYSFFGTV